MRVYVAGAAAEMSRVIDAIAALEGAGIAVTCTWPQVVAATPGGANPADASCADRARWSGRDVTEVADSDVLWFLVPDGLTTRGAWFESGVAHALGKHLVFSGPTTHQSVFCALGEEFISDESALVYLKRWRDEQVVAL
jgi:hypothetical protein